MTRGFPEAEFRTRVSNAQALMAAQGLGAILMTTEPNVRYFSGFLTRFWESPSRPWFLIVPAAGEPIAVIPSIGSVLMGRGWVKDIRTWSAPNLEDDGVTLLADTLREVGGPIGVPSGYETHLRMPLADFERVKTLSGLEFTGDAGIVADLRAVKSEAEIAKIEVACGIAARSFARMGEIAREGISVEQVFRDFQRLLLEEGADWVPYISGAAAPGGYDDVISLASPDPMAAGDVLMLDTGAIWDGYFCDYDRNFSIGKPSEAVQSAHARLIDATHAGLEAARPGVTARDVWRAMADIAGAGEEAGRLGHALGMQLTEGLSLTPRDETVLKPGMVITLEPGTQVSPGKIMVHEENIVITEGVPRVISPLADPEIVQI
ncbi:putative peptidase [Roseovarius albus]|uniref:Putative peptidase n=1 Tax=Roseovarius albus TaxID=1247867 RepID=A0A1X6ZDL3_9RHOB|nr:Xaa-Pro peptidase family protein [Roseovarius albus]SLN47929.1 putative peptidase [Roseovarius albus]